MIKLWVGLYFDVEFLALSHIRFDVIVTRDYDINITPCPSSSPGVWEQKQHIVHEVASGYKLLVKCLTQLQLLHV